MKTSKLLLHLSTMLAVVFLHTSCQNDRQIDTDFFIPIKDSKLYVRLAGNADGPLIINLHGGPGGFSGFARETYKEFLEGEYLIAYLDQRGSGKSEIAKDSTMLNMQQFVTDLDFVVDSLKNRYGTKNINLLGSSWGGTLGLLYMIDHQEKINSFACISGKADGMYPILALIEKERVLAEEFLRKAKDSSSKARYTAILDKLIEIEQSGFNEFFNDMNLLKHAYPKELGFNAYWANKDAHKKAIELGKDTAYYKRAGYSMELFDSAMAKFEYVNRVFRNTYAYNHLNIIDDISVIEKPVLVLQGEFDYAIGVNQGRMIYDALTGVPTDNKVLRIVPNAAHNLNLEATREYTEAIKSFFDKHNN